MLRDPDRPGEDGYMIRRLVMESAKEYQEWAKSVPATASLPTTHEHCIEHLTLPDGRSVIDFTVRRKRGTDGQLPPEPDKLNDMSEESLEVEAAKAGLKVDAFKKLSGKAARVKAIREAKAAKK